MKQNNNIMTSIHMLTHYPTSNINRGRDGMPKSIIFGNGRAGQQRGRWSSQAQKRAARLVFQEFLPEEDRAIRTDELPQMVGEELKAMGASEVEREAIMRKLAGVGSGKSKGEYKKELDKVVTSVSLFITPAEVAEVSRRMLDYYRRVEQEGGKKWNDLAMRSIESEIALQGMPKSPEVALFGRMSTSLLFPNVPAAVSVAHAITTTQLAVQLDFWTAMNDRKKGGGAGAMGDAAISANPYYINWAISIKQLTENLRGDGEKALDVVVKLLDSVARTVPIGMINQANHRTAPALFAVEIAGVNTACNYSDAFIEPIKRTDGSNILSESVSQLSRRMAQVSAEDSRYPRYVVYYSSFGELENGVKEKGLPELLNKARELLASDNLPLAISMEEELNG